MRFSYLDVLEFCPLFSMQFQRKYLPARSSDHHVPRSVNKSMLQKKLPLSGILLSFWPIVCSMTLGPGDQWELSALPRMISPSIAKLAVAPPSCRICENRNLEKSCIAVLAKCHACFAICIRDTSPSCVLAPPGTDVGDHWAFLSVARSNTRVIFFLSTTPHTGHHETAVADT